MKLEILRRITPKLKATKLKPHPDRDWNTLFRCVAISIEIGQNDICEGLSAFVAHPLSEPLDTTSLHITLLFLRVTESRNLPRVGRRRLTRSHMQNFVKFTIIL